MSGDRPPSNALLTRMATGFQMTQMVYVITKLGVADALVGGPRRAEEIAAAVGADARSLYRLLRALASLELLTQDDEERFGLTPAAQRLRADVPGSLRPLILTYGEPWWWSAYGELLHAVRTGESAFEHVHGMEFFAYLDRDPEAAAVFNANMTAMTSIEAEAVAAAYDFSGTRRLVDVGGGHGTLAAAILESQPAARAVLFDQPSVIDGAREVVARLGIGGRCELVGGDFFVTVPAGADTYTLKDIIHDWDDERAVTILRRCRRAMPDDAKLLVIERVIAPGDQPSIGKLVDVTMLVMTGGMERSGEEYRALLAAAGLDVRRIIVTGTGTSIIESVPGG